MAGWSVPDDGLVIDIFEAPQKLRPEGFLIDLGLVLGEHTFEVQAESDGASDVDVVEGLYGDIRHRFDQLLRGLLKEIYTKDFFRPIPPMLDNGQQVDLYKLFLIVTENGGYDSVSKKSLWDFVGEETGCGRSVGSTVKFIYSKYLNTLETWLKKFADSKVSDSVIGDCNLDFSRILMDFQADIKGILSSFTGKEENDEVSRRLGSKCAIKGVMGMTMESDGAPKVRDYENMNVDMQDSKSNEPSLGESSNEDEVMETLDETDGGKISFDSNKDKMTNAANSDEVDGMPGLFDGVKRCDADDDVLSLDASDVRKESFGHKRKRESMEMLASNVSIQLLSWVTGIARNPCDPAVSSLPDRSKWKSHSNEERWKQVLLFREAVFYKRNFESGSEKLNWQSQKMHPCMYDDQLGLTYNLRERLKIDKKPISGNSASVLRTSSDSSSGTLCDPDKTPSPRAEGRAEKESLESSAIHLGVDKCGTKSIRLGQAHQAKVPEWTGVISESDSKWFGSQIWPSGKINHKLLIERDPIGKGRQDSCGCQVSGSVECVRFHIAEKRTKVRLELGMAFYELNLVKSGEEVRHYWTVEEEKKFNDVVKSNHSNEKGFWGDLFRSFPRKTREDLVSYYYNVFLLQRRAFQNRHIPDEIDSDDESECVPLGTVFGHQALKSPSSRLLSPRKPRK